MFYTFIQQLASEPKGSIGEESTEKGTYLIGEDDRSNRRETKSEAGEYRHPKYTSNRKIRQGTTTKGGRRRVAPLIESSMDSSYPQTPKISGYQLLLISKYKTAKAVWDALKKRHVEENRVQQAKQQTLKSEFEMLQMEENESIDSFVTKLTGIINKAVSVGLAYEDSTLVRKLLNAVPDRFLQIVASIEQYSNLDTMSLDEAIGRLKTFEERLKYKNERPVNTQERLLFRSERKNWESSQNSFKKETDSNSNKFTHDKSKVLCFKCKEYGHFANKCPSKKEEQSNLIEEDLEPTLLMTIVEEAPSCFINQEESRSKNGRKFHSASN
nr:putative zinc finger, CCHC-type [Tanacetum cinerariifolium]